MDASIQKILNRRCTPQRWDVVSDVFKAGEVCSNGCEWSRNGGCHLLDTSRTIATFCPGYEDQIEEDA